MKAEINDPPATVILLSLLAMHSRSDLGWLGVSTALAVPGFSRHPVHIPSEAHYLRFEGGWLHTKLINSDCARRAMNFLDWAQWRMVKGSQKQNGSCRIPTEARFILCLHNVLGRCGQLDPHNGRRRFGLGEILLLTACLFLCHAETAGSQTNAKTLSEIFWRAQHHAFPIFASHIIDVQLQERSYLESIIKKLGAESIRLSLAAGFVDREPFLKHTIWMYLIVFQIILSV